MRRIMMSAAAVAAFAASSSASAAAWTPPAQVKIVQPGTYDPPRVYNSIASALASIGDASSTKRYLIKVMPGVWSAPAGGLQMKAYVDVQGSGSANTVITGSDTGNAFNMCTSGVVIMANEMTLSDLKVENLAPPVGSDHRHSNAILFSGVKARLDRVAVWSGSDTVAGGLNNGVALCGTVNDATLTHVDVEAHNLGEWQANAVMAGPGALTITDSKLTAIQRSGTGMGKGINYWDVGARVTVANTSIFVDSPYATGVDTSGNTFDVRNTTVTAKATLGCDMLRADDGSVTRIVGSQFIMDGGSVMCGYHLENGPVSIATSRLDGDRTNLLPARIVGCLDAAFVAIPNQ